MFLLLGVNCLYAQAPVITSFSPTSGATNSSITISGSNFNTTAAHNHVFFGTVKATVTAATSSSLTVTVPDGISYQPISVLNTSNKLTGSSNLSFNNTFYSAGFKVSPRADIQTASNPYGVVLADIDGDGKPDIIVANAGSASVSVYHNNSTPGNLSSVAFDAGVGFGAGSQPISLAVADLNGDGKPDVVAANYNSGSISILKNTSVAGGITSASFAAAVTLTVGSNPSAVSITDIDGDGKPDVVVSNAYGKSISIFRNISTGSLTSASFAARVDINTGTYISYLTTSDIDGDGKPDIVAVNVLNNNISVFLNISSVGSISTSSFAAPVTEATGVFPLFVAAGDLDGDGKPDLAVANKNDGTVSLLHNSSTSGSISFDPAISLAVGNSPEAVALGQADGSGLPDIVVANSGSNTITGYRNISTPGTFSFSNRTDGPTGSGPVSVFMGDADGDGKADIFVSGLGNNNLCIYRNNSVSLAPDITYHTPNVYTVNNPIAPVLPVNTGGPVVLPDYGTVSTFAGSTTSGLVDGMDTAARFYQPLGLATDTAGNIYVADVNNNKIRKITPIGLVSTLNGTFSEPTGVYPDIAGNVYVANLYGNAVQEIKPDGNVYQIASVVSPTGIVADSHGNVFFSDQGQTHSIYKITPDGTKTLFAGQSHSGYADGTGSGAAFNQPFGLTIDKDDNIYVADFGNNRIRKITPLAVVTTLAGPSGLSGPQGVARDAVGNLFVGNFTSNNITEITVGNAVKIIAGNGSQGYADGSGAAARFFQPDGVAVDTADNVYVGDLGNNLIRKIAVTAYTIFPQLPAGLHFNNITGAITGTPTATSSASTYKVTAYNNSGSSSFDISIAVNPVAPLAKLPVADLAIHKAVSPNGDGINDKMIIENINQYPQNKLTVINSKGEKVYEISGYNNAAKAFDGRSNITGLKQPNGTYFYRLEYNVNGETKNQTGYIALKN